MTAPRRMMSKDGRCPACGKRHGYVEVSLGADNPYQEEMAVRVPACKTRRCEVGRLDKHEPRALSVAIEGDGT